MRIHYVQYLKEHMPKKIIKGKEYIINSEKKKFIL